MGDDRPNVAWGDATNATPIEDIRRLMERTREASIYRVEAEDERAEREANELRWMARAYALYGPSLEPTES